MMQQTDIKEFTSILRSTMHLFDKELSADALKIWWATMENVSMPDFRKAMTQHVSVSQFSPKPADILNQFRQSDKPGAEEAWAMIPKDERDSVVWTNDMAVAFGAASPLLREGDPIGARMAFKEVYEREIAKNNPTKWIPSFGFDRSGREAALQQAVVLNRLTMDAAVGFMPDSDILLNFAGKNTAPMLENLTAIKQIASGIAKPTPEENLEYDESSLIQQVKDKKAENDVSI